MSFDEVIRVGQIGTVFLTTVTKVQSGAEVPYDLTGSNLQQLEIQDPNGKRLTPINATIVNPPGTDGLLTYTDNTGIFTIAGRWQVRGIVGYATGAKFYGSWHGFTVAE